MQMKRVSPPILERNLALGLVRRLHLTLLKIHRFSIKKPKTTLIFLSLFLLSSFVPLKSLKMLISIDDLIDPDFHTYEQLNELKDRFLSQDEIGIIISRKDGLIPNKSEMCGLLHWIQKQADTRSDLNAIVSTLGLSWPTETHAKFRTLPMLNIDCTNTLPESEVITAGMAQITKSPWRGTLTSQKGTDLAILIYPDARKQASILGTFNPLLVEELQKSFQEIVLQKHPHLKAIWIGDGIFQYHLHKGYETMPGLNMLMGFLLIIFLRLFLGTLLSGGLFLSVVTCITLPIYAGMALANHPIDVLSSSLSLMIFISSLEDFIFLSYFSQKYGWRKGFRRLILPSFFTSLTTVIGFGSLAFADLDMIRRFGLWAAASAALEWVFMLVALPALLKAIPRLQKWTRPEKAVHFKFFNLNHRKAPRLVTWLALLAFPIGLWATQKLYVSDSPIRLFRSDHPARQAAREIKKTRGWQGTASLVFSDHENKEFNQSVLKTVETWPLVSQIEDPYTINSYLTNDLSPSMGAYFTELIKDNTLGHRLGPDDRGVSRSLLYLRDLDISNINPMRKKIADLCPNQKCWLAGSVVSYGELGERVLSSLYKSLGGSLVLVSLVLLFLCLAFNKSSFFPLFISAMWGPAALLCVFYFFNIPIYYILSMVASILVGLTGDNAIQFLLFFKKNTTLNHSVNKIGTASLLVTCGTVLATGVFFFGYFDPMRTLGLLMMLGVFLSAFGDIWLLKGLLKTKNSL